MRQVLISHSEGDAFVRCEQQHFYAYGDKLQSKNKSDGLTRGTYDHEVLEVYFRFLRVGATWEKARDMAMKRLYSMMTRPGIKMELLHQLVEILPGYFEYDRKNFVNTGWKVIAVEKEYRLILPNTAEGIEWVYPFTVDLVRADPAGYIWFWDHKTIYNFKTDDEINLMPQLPRYIGGARAMGHDIRGGKLNQIRWRNVKSTADNDHYRTVNIPLSDAKVRNMFREHIKAMGAITRYKTMDLEQWRASVRRTLSEMVCKNCAFTTLCILDLNDVNTEGTKSSMYEPNTYGYKVALDDGS